MNIMVIAYKPKADPQTRMVGAQLSRLTENRWTVPSKG